MDLVGHPRFLVWVHLDLLLHSDCTHAVLDVGQYCVCECGQVLMVESLPLCLVKAVLESGEGVVRPGDNCLSFGLCLSAEGGVCWSQEQ